MNIKIINHPGGIIQNTDKPIINVLGDVNIEKGEKKQTVVNPDDEYYEFEEVGSETSNEGVKKEESPQEHQMGNEEKLNLDTPRIVLQNMLQEDWFDEVCTDKKLYNESWRNKFVIDFMASEHGIYMATLWKKKDRWDKTKGEFLGALVYAGVLKENKLSFARSYLGIDKNTHDDDEKKQIKTFANYVGQGKSQPYVAWVKDYVNKIKAKE